MALIKFGMMMTDARGKLGGHVFTKARNGATVRTKVTPINPQTAAQSFARAVFGTVSSAWRDLTEPQRSAWNAAVSDYSRTNIFGDNYLPSGKNLFVQLNCNLLNVGKNLIDNPPAPVAVPSLLLGGVIFDTAVEELVFSYLASEPPAGYTKVIEASRPFSPGKYNFSGSFSKIFSWDGTSEPTPLAAYTDYVSKFGSPNVGLKIAFRTYVIVNATGQKSPYSEFSTIVV